MNPQFIEPASIIRDRAIAIGWFMTLGSLAVLNCLVWWLALWLREFNHTWTDHRWSRVLHWLEGAQGVQFAAAALAAAIVSRPGVFRGVAACVPVGAGLGWTVWYTNVNSIYYWGNRTPVWLPAAEDAMSPAAVLMLIHAGAACVTLFAMTWSGLILLASLCFVAALGAIAHQTLHLNPPVLAPVFLSLWQILIAGLLMAWAFRERGRPQPMPRQRVCVKCKYSLDGLSGPICPECGTDHSPEISA